MGKFNHPKTIKEGPNAVEQIKQTYYENKKLANSLAWAAVLMVVMKVGSVYLQGKEQ